MPRWLEGRLVGLQQFIMGSQNSVQEETVPAPVTLHVYDLGTGGEVKTLNSVLEKLGTGVFHCGVEVYGKEWSFHHIFWGTGVFKCDPMECSQHTYRQSVSMGVTTMSEDEVEQLLTVMRKEWSGTSYDLLTKNCCHFSNDFCVRLGVGPIPWWTHNLAGAGASVREMYEGVSGALNPTLLMSNFMGRGQQPSDDPNEKTKVPPHLRKMTV